MASSAQSKIFSPWYRQMKFWLAIVIISAATFVGGYFWGTTKAPTPKIVPLRLSGYQFISPLLACNITGSNAASSQAQNLNEKITGVINQHVQNGDVEKASMYFVDYNQNFSMSVNGDEKYYPSSIGKIPIMMAYFALAEHSSRSVLDQQILFPVGSPDLNATQDIKPPQAIVPGKSYSVNELIGYMIKDSDNNAAQLLFENIEENNPETLQDIYNNLSVPINYNPTEATLDFMTPAQVGMLFRILYNGTYLSDEDSESALQLLSESTFTQGIVAGVPAGSTVVAHKLGLVGLQNDGVTTEHELHDCGLVYAPNHTYLLCVMTRGQAPLPQMESTIADISKAVYQEVENGYK